MHSRGINAVIIGHEYVHEVYFTRNSHIRPITMLPKTDGPDVLVR